MEYHLIFQQNLIRALNDTGPRGVITRALFGLQKLSTDLRIRQLLAMKRCNLRMLQGSSEKDTAQEMNNLAIPLSRLLPEHVKPNALLVQDIHTLHAIGVLDIEDMLTTDKTHVLPASSLLHICSKRGVKPKHIGAWNRLAHMLTHGTSHPGGRAKASDLTKEERKLHASVMECLKSAYEEDPMQLGRNILQMLADLQAYNGPITRLGTPC